MITFSRALRKVVGRVPREAAQAARAAPRTETLETPPVEIAPNDPILTYFQSASGPIAVDELKLESPAVEALRQAGVKMVVPLISQGELIGLLNLGPRLSQQEYSSDDRQLLDKLAAQAAPAVRVAQLVREQEAEVRARERIEQELRVAQLIQQQFLPKHLPRLPGWQVGAYYRAAREVGGDFYDFIDLPEGRIGVVVGDVTGHGVPAALVMATTRSVIRSDAPRLVSPSAVLERANEFLYADVPANMFVTCLYAVLEPATGRMTFSNAGHNLPYVRTESGTVELRATGMPLGLMPGMRYEETVAFVRLGESILLHSDGLAEAHSTSREMFGFPRLRSLVAGHPGGPKLIDTLIAELHSFTGPAWEQEDDITLVTLSRSAQSSDARLVTEFEVPSEPGNERLVMERVATAVAPLGLEQRRLERLKTAVSEAAMNAIEHGNQGRAELPVQVQVVASNGRLSVSITDKGGGKPIPEAETPDIEAKLAGLQKPRGWGLFLIKNMVDEMNVTTDDVHHTVQLVLDLTRPAEGSA